MSRVLISERHLSDIGRAIRQKLNVQTKYLPSQMADAVREIPHSIADDGQPFTPSTSADKVLVSEQSIADIGDAIRSGLDVETKYLPSQMADAILSIRKGTQMLSVVHMPTVTSYEVGDALNLDGCVVMFYGSGVGVDVTNQCVFSPANGHILDASGDVSVEVSYTSDGVSYSTAFNISVSEAFTAKMYIGLYFPETETITVNLNTEYKENDDTTDAFPCTIIWGDNTKEVVSGEVKSFSFQGDTYYHYVASASHTYSSGSANLVVCNRGNDKLNVTEIKNSNRSKENIVSIDARDGLWGLPDMSDQVSTSTRFTTLYVGNNAVGSTGFYNCAALTNLFVDNGAIIDSYAFGSCTSLGPNLELNANTYQGSAFADCSGIRNAWIRDSVKTVGSDLFESDSYSGNLPIETIYCEADSKPDGWNENWNRSASGYYTVVWGQKTSPF